MTARNPVGGKTMYEPLNVGQATAKNQFSNSSGFSYDADGNMTKNGGELYTYDAEDRLATAQNQCSPLIFGLCWATCQMVQLRPWHHK